LSNLHEITLIIIIIITILLCIVREYLPTMVAYTILGQVDI